MSKKAGGAVIRRCTSQAEREEFVDFGVAEIVGNFGGFDESDTNIHRILLRVERRLDELFNEKKAKREDEEKDRKCRENSQPPLNE